MGYDRKTRFRSAIARRARSKLHPGPSHTSYPTAWFTDGYDESRFPHDTAPKTKCA